MSELGTNVQEYTSVAKKESYMPHFALHKRRVPTEKLTRVYLPIFIPQATTTVGTYVVGIVPYDSHVVDVKHVCKTISAAAKVQVRIGTKTSMMTAQDGSVTVATGALASDTDDRKVDKGDIISVVISETSGDLLHLALLITLEPVE